MSENPTLHALEEMERRYCVYLSRCCDKQVLAAFEKETRYGFPALARLAKAEAVKRGLLN